MRVYLDNAATTKLDERVFSEMKPYYTEVFGNASSIHKYGREAMKGLNAARDTIAKLIGAKPSEIYFTSGGTESDNWALRGVVMASKYPKKHIITTNIEHPAILDTLEVLKKEGVEVSYAKVDSQGLVSVEDIKALIKENTVLVTVMSANNEIGTIQPIAEIGAVCKEEGVYFHTDAVQAYESLDINVNEMNIDLMSLSAHKFHGPKGVGILYVRSGVKIGRIVTGGHQERGLRAGTSATPLIVGMAKAMEIACIERSEYNKNVAKLRDYLVERVLKEIPYSYYNGSSEKRLPSNANISFEFIEGESILIQLDLSGIAVSTGSACSSGSLEPSHVIVALGVREELAHSSIRFSLSNDTTKEELDYVIKALKIAVERLRAASPLFNVEKGEGYYV